MIERCVHHTHPSINLIEAITSFRLIEHEYGAIVNSIDAAVVGRASLAEAGSYTGLTATEIEMSIISVIGRIASDFSAARARYQTERAIRALPVELQKDIGWPEVVDSHTAYGRGVGPRAGAKQS